MVRPPNMPSAEIPPMGIRHVGPYVLLRVTRSLRFRRLKKSTFARTLLVPNLKSLLPRTSSTVRRGSKRVCGATRGTTAVALHVAAAPHWPRLRPSDGTIWSFLTVQFALYVAPDTFWSTALATKPIGNG